MCQACGPAHSRHRAHQGRPRALPHRRQVGNVEEAVASVHGGSPGVHIPSEAGCWHARATRELSCLSCVRRGHAATPLGAGGSSMRSPATGSGLSGCHTTCSRIPDITLASILSGNSQAANASMVAMARAARPPVRHQHDLDICTERDRRHSTRLQASFEPEVHSSTASEAKGPKARTGLVVQWLSTDCGARRPSKVPLARAPLLITPAQSAL